MRIPTQASLSEFEQLVLLALARLGERAYGVTIRQEITGRAGKAVSLAAVYATLGRLEERGLVSSRIAAPTATRGGRAKKFFAIEARGTAALLEARDAMQRMWQGLELGAS